MFPMWMDNGLNPLISVCRGRDTLAIAVRHLSDLHQASAWFALSLLAFCASAPCHVHTWPEGRVETRAGSPGSPASPTTYVSSVSMASPHAAPPWMDSMAVE